MHREFSKINSKNSMRTFMRANSVNKSPTKFKSPKSTRSQNKSYNKKSFNRTESIDFAPFVRKNKLSHDFEMGKDNSKKTNQMSKIENINSFLLKCIKSKDLKKAIKSEQFFLDEMVDMIYMGTWNRLDLKRMYMFFIECFKKKVN